MRSGGEYENNQTNKRGLIKELDEEGFRIRVEFADEDASETHWIDVLSGDGSSYNMPPVGSEVWCAMDAKGEDGCLMGVKYNKKDAPPYSSKDALGQKFSGGFVLIDKASGAATMQFSSLTITCDDIKFAGSAFSHNGKNIGFDHKHTGVVAGGDPSGEPQ